MIYLPQSIIFPVNKYKEVILALRSVDLTRRGRYFVMLYYDVVCVIMHRLFSMVVDEISIKVHSMVLYLLIIARTKHCFDDKKPREIERRERWGVS